MELVELVEFVPLEKCTKPHFFVQQLSARQKLVILEDDQADHF